MDERPAPGEVDAGYDGAGPEPPTWMTWREAVGVVCYRPHLRKTAVIALVGGQALLLRRLTDEGAHRVRQP